MFSLFFMAFTEVFKGKVLTFRNEEIRRRRMDGATESGCHHRRWNGWLRARIEKVLKCDWVLLEHKFLRMIP